MRTRSIIMTSTVVVATVMAVLTRTPRGCISAYHHPIALLSYRRAFSSSLKLVQFTTLQQRQQPTQYRSTIIRTTTQRWMSDVDEKATAQPGVPETAISSERTEEEKELIKAAREAKK